VTRRNVNVHATAKGNGNRDGPTESEKGDNEANKKEGKGENENNRKGSKHLRDI